QPGHVYCPAGSLCGCNWKLNAPPDQVHSVGCLIPRNWDLSMIFAPVPYPVDRKPSSCMLTSRKSPHPRRYLAGTWHRFVEPLEPKPLQLSLRKRGDENYRSFVSIAGDKRPQFNTFLTLCGLLRGVPLARSK